MRRRLALLLLTPLLVGGCGPVDGPDVQTRTVEEYRSEVCGALEDVTDAINSGDASAYKSSLGEAVQAANDFQDAYPDNTDAQFLSGFSEALRDVPPEGYQGDQLAELQAQSGQVDAVCNG